MILGLKRKSHKMARENIHPATQALHADDRLNLVTDVAPPIHLSTTFRYPDNPSELIISEDPVVCDPDPAKYYNVSY